MGLEDYSPIEDNSGPKSSEISEKFKESVKKSQTGIKRVAKDEKKAKKSDFLLASFLIEIIKNPKYDFLLNDLFRTLEFSGNNSNFVLGIMSIIYMPISDKIREILGVKKIVFSPNITKEIIDFDDNLLDDIIKNRINEWLIDIDYYLSHDYSSINLLRLKENLDYKKYNKSEMDYNNIVIFMGKVFSYFFKELNINISENKSLQYSEFILGEIKNNINKLEIEVI